MRVLLLASVLLLGASGAALAQEPSAPADDPAPEATPTGDEGGANVWNPNAKPGEAGGKHDGKIYDGLTMEELEGVVKGYGLPHERSGDNAINATTPDGLNFTLYLLDCAEGGEKRCATLNFVSFAFLETPKVTLRGLNEWNNNAWGARGVLYKDGTSAVIANWALDGGITTQWVANRLWNYSGSLKSFSDFVGGVAPPPN